MQKFLDWFQIWSDRFTDSELANQIFMIGVMAGSMFAVGQGIYRAVLKIRAHLAKRRTQAVAARKQERARFIAQVAKEISEILEIDEPKTAGVCCSGSSSSGSQSSGACHSGSSCSAPADPAWQVITIKLDGGVKMECGIDRWESIFEFIRQNEGCTFEEAAMNCVKS